VFDRLGIRSVPVAVDAALPSGKPTLLTAPRGRVLHAPLEHSGGSGGEVRVDRLRAAHFLQYLQQTPALTGVAFLGSNTLALEVHVVDQRIAAGRCTRERAEARLDDARSGCGDRGEHGIAGRLQTRNHELRLQCRRIQQQTAQLSGFRAVALIEELLPAEPGAIRSRCLVDPGGHGDIARRQECQ
jgi:hypothetical protein